MREETTFRIRAFWQALEKAAQEQPEEYMNEARWCELKNFPAGSCDLASNCLAQYLKDCGEKGEPIILFMCGNQDFYKAENSTVHTHVIVIHNGEYIVLTLDQFDEYTDYIASEPLETCGVIGRLLRKIPQNEGEIETRRINIDRLQRIYAWLRNRADIILKADPQWQAREQLIEHTRKAAMALFSFSQTTPETRTDAPALDK